MPFSFSLGGRKRVIAHQSPCHFGIQFANLARKTDQLGPGLTQIGQISDI